MKTTITVIKADIGSIGGHIRPSNKIIACVDEFVKKNKVVESSYVFSVGDDIAIVMTHGLEKDNPIIHKIAWDAFMAGTKIAREQGLYGAGQDLLKDSFSGNIRGAGPAVAEIEIDERPNEPFVVFLADKTDPGAYNLPLYLAFSDPCHNSGLILSSSLSKGFKYRIMDVSDTKDSIIELDSPEEMYDVATLLRDNERFVVESIYSRHSEKQVAAVSTSRLHNIAGEYTGKDDPVMIVRAQNDFPSTGEILSPFTICHYVAGFMRGSHTGPLMPVKKNTIVSYFDGPPVVCALGFCVHNRKLTEPVDLFDQPLWDEVRRKASKKALGIREQGFSGNAMLGMAELEYHEAVVDRLKKLSGRFKRE